MTDHLVAIADGTIVGRVEQRREGKLAFTYDDAWRRADNAWPVSLSLPLVVAEHDDEPVRAFLAGLLPDSERVLESWGRRFGASPRNPFALLGHVGEDCAGAVQFVRPERVELLLHQAGDSVDWVTEAEVAQRLGALRQDASAGRRLRDTGQFSLAGAQPKTALLLENGRWGVPSGRTPTTHILKPPTGDYDGFPENEHLCLETARAAGLPVARSSIMRFENEIAFVTERYDRERRGGRLVRLHQEDTCQALGVPPQRKYENEGGPGLDAIVGLLRDYSRAANDDIRTFFEAAAFSWVAAGSDAHAKNYSILIGAGGAVRLAPLYDLLSMLPYDDSPLHRVRVAMKIGGEYNVLKIGRRHWEKTAKQTGVRADFLLPVVKALVGRIPDAVRTAQEAATTSGLKHSLILQLADGIAGRARDCLRQLTN